MNWLASGKGRRIIPKFEHFTSNTPTTAKSGYLVSIALPLPVRKLFDYLPALQARQRSHYFAGQRCQVPFGNRKLLGFVIKTHQQFKHPEDYYKAIIALLDTEPVIPASTLSVYQWIAQYYHASLGEVIARAIPPLLRKQENQEDIVLKISELIWKLSHPASEAALKPRAREIRGQKQRNLLLAIGQHPAGLAQRHILAAGFKRAQIKALADKGHIQCHRQLAVTDTGTAVQKLPPLNSEQQAAFSAMVKQQTPFTPILLHGVTGSGKTEVYIHWLNHLLNNADPASEADPAALVLVPEISLTPQTVRRFKQYFGNRVICYHSAMTAKERLLSWFLTLEQKASIIIGTRSALLLPFHHLATIIVDEEHDNSFKQQDGARYNARDVAILRARLSACPVIMGSATPSFETLYNVDQSRFIKLELKQRHNNQPLPRFEIIETKSRPLQGGISPPAFAAISEKLSAGEQVMIFINRRGYAPVLACTDCGWSAECSTCDIKLTLHLRQQRLRCHHCDRSVHLPTICPTCKSVNIKAIGVGTERTEEALSKQFPSTAIHRIDRDNTQSQQNFNRLMKQINSGESCLVVGTQMLAKGHDFANLNMVLIINADGGFFSNDFRATEKTAQLIMQVAGRAGRRHQQGRVLLQTQLPDHPIIRAICNHDYGAIYNEEIKLRLQADLPPVSSLCIIRAEAESLDSGIATLTTFKQQIGNLNDRDIRLFGPAPSLLQRKSNRYHCLLWVLAKDKSILRKSIHYWLTWRQEKNLKTSSKVRWLLDVDPAETL